MAFENDKKKILEFILELYDWLEVSFSKNQDSIGNHEWPIIYVTEILQEEAHLAWSEFTNDYPKKFFRRSISHFKEKRLKAHGLYGAQLEYKLKIVNIAVKEAKSNRQGWKRKLLNVLDNLLESIGSGLPGYGALKELKDSLLVGIYE